MGFLIYLPIYLLIYLPIYQDCSYLTWLLFCYYGDNKIYILILY